MECALLLLELHSMYLTEGTHLLRVREGGASWGATLLGICSFAPSSGFEVGGRATDPVEVLT